MKRFLFRAFCGSVLLNSLLLNAQDTSNPASKPVEEPFDNPIDAKPKPAASAKPDWENINSDSFDIPIPTSNLPNEMPIQEPLPPPSKTEVYSVIFRAFERATLSAQVTASVEKIDFRMGESFHKKDLLILLDETVFQGLIKKAQGSLIKAETELHSKTQLYANNIASVFELKTAEANVAIATSDLISAKHALQACYVIAPFNGKVVQLFVEEAELIQEGKPLIEIVNDQQLIGQVLVPANAINLKKIMLEKPLEIQVRETGKTVLGKILRVGSVIDPASSLIKIDIVVDNNAGELRPGMIGQTTLEDPTYTSIKPISFSQK